MTGSKMLALVVAIGSMGFPSWRSREHMHGARNKGRRPVEIRVELGQDRFVTQESMVARIVTPKYRLYAHRSPEPGRQSEHAAGVHNHRTVVS